MAKAIFGIEQLRTAVGEQLFLKAYLESNDSSQKKVWASSFDGVSVELLGRKYLSPRDYEIIALLAPFRSSYLGDAVPLISNVRVELIDELLSSGQLFFGSDFHRRLGPGKPRQANPVWRVLSDGTQSASFCVSPAASRIIPVSSPRFLDTVSCEIGPLEVNLSPEIIGQWLRLPLIPAGSSSSASKDLRDGLARYGLPAPSAIKPGVRLQPQAAITPDSYYLDAEPCSPSAALGNSLVMELGVRVGNIKLNILPELRQLLSKMGAADVERFLSRETIEIHDANIGRISISTAVLNPVIDLLRELPTRALDTNGRAKLSDAEALVLFHADLGVEWEGTIRDQMLEHLSYRQSVVALPDTFHATLRSYQNLGVSWLQALGELNLGGILADDMGLGKTVQILAHLAIEKHQHRLDGPCLIVCPKSVLPNWVSESQRFTPDFSLLVLQDLAREERTTDLSRHDIVMTNYALLSRDILFLEKQVFSYVILDESQQIKNIATAVSQSANRLNARRRLCLSGTPIENHLGELWSHFKFLMPNLLGSYEDFERKYRNPIERADSKVAQNALRARVAPFILRRTKAEVAPELPALTEITKTVELTPSQRALYDSLCATALGQIREKISVAGFAASRFLILQTLLRLRQVCCDPRLISEQSNAIDSAKLQVLIETLETLRAEGRRALVFSQFTSMLNLIEPKLIESGLAFVRLDGSTKNRELPVTTFQSGEVSVFLISLRAGGTGLNLTAADTVIHYDPWWNPAAAEQATARAHRIGQNSAVFSYHLLAKDTVEERVVALQSRKKALASDILGQGAMSHPSFSEDDFELLFAPSTQRKESEGGLSV